MSRTANNSKGDPNVPKVKDINNYLEELFTNSMPGFINFYEYLEDYRAIPKGYFTTEHFKILALNSEMMFYNLYIKRIHQENARKVDIAKAEKEKEEDLSVRTVEELQMARAYLQAQTELVNRELAKATAERTEEDKKN